MLHDCGRTGWVAWAGSGLGGAVALAFATAGCRLALTGRSRETLAETQAQVQAAGGSAMLALADVGKAHEVTRAHREVAEALGDIEILVNNAGNNTAQRHWPHLSAEDLEQIVH